MEIRPAVAADAVQASTVLRRSITELCTADHNSEVATLTEWLANKTTETVRRWVESNPAGFLVAVEGANILGVGAVTPAGEIALNYVSPDARFRGVSKGMLRALEAQARANGCSRATLTSTITAHQFYLAHGYKDAGSPVASFGGMPAYPMIKEFPTEDLAPDS